MLVGEIFFILIVIWTPCILCDRWDDQETRKFVAEYIPKLQQNLRRANDDSATVGGPMEKNNEIINDLILKVDENYIKPKIISKNNKHYEIHLIKLQYVNGLKKHNLIVKEKSDDNPLIYVINPVETKIPQAFVSQKEFKDILNNRVKKQRNEVYRSGDPLLRYNSTYWTKITWSKPPLIPKKFPYQYLFTKRQHNTKEPNMRKHVSLKKVSPPIPYPRNRTRNSTIKIHKPRYLRSNETSKVKIKKAKYLRSNRTSKVKTVKVQYLRNNRTSRAVRNKTISLKNNGTVKAKTIHLRSNRSITTKRNKKIMRNSHIFKKSVTEEISKAKIIHKQINETIERQTTTEITTEKPTIEIELSPTKNEVTSTSELFTTKEQFTEEVTLEKPTNSDVTPEKLKADAKTKLETAKTITKNIGDSKNEEEKESPTEKLTTEDKTTEEPTHNETVNMETKIHSKEEQESIPTEKAETPASEDTTKSNDNTDSTTESINTANEKVDLSNAEGNTESINTANQEVDLSTDQSKAEETTLRKPLPFRTTVVKRSTTKARTATTRTRLSRPLVFMGEMGNGNSWDK